MAGRIKSQLGSPNHKQQPAPRKSDSDIGYLWGKAGKARAKQHENKANAGFKMWENEK